MPEGTEFELQEFVEGVEVSCEGWFNAPKFPDPFNITSAARCEGQPGVRVHRPANAGHRAVHRDDPVARNVRAAASPLFDILLTAMNVEVFPRARPLERFPGEMEPAPAWGRHARHRDTRERAVAASYLSGIRFRPVDLNEERRWHYLERKQRLAWAVALMRQRRRRLTPEELEELLE